jgi:predicted RNase H-like HicB family nuclease
MDLTIEADRETDGRWFAEVMELPGVITYGATRAEAVMNAKALALHVIADRIEHGEEPTELVGVSFKAARANGRQQRRSASSLRRFG